jgi:hypothetical protein
MGCGGSYTYGELVRHAALIFAVTASRRFALVDLVHAETRR